MAATKVKAIPYETAAKSFEKILIPALKGQTFSELFEKSDEKSEKVKQAVRDFIDAAEDAGLHGDAKALFTRVTNEPEERFTNLAYVRRRIREGSLKFSPPFSEVAKKLSTA